VNVEDANTINFHLGACQTLTSSNSSRTAENEDDDDDDDDEFEEPDEVVDGNGEKPPLKTWWRFWISLARRISFPFCCSIITLVFDIADIVN
jgi:hypothetical protein